MKDLNFADEDRTFLEQPRVEEAADPDYGLDGGTNDEYVFSADTGDEVYIQEACSESVPEQVHDDIDVVL